MIDHGTRLISLVVLCLSMSSSQLFAQTDQPSIENGAKVTLELTIRIPTEHLMIPSHRSEYTHGANELIPSLEQALAGMHAGEGKRVELAADQAFGQYDAQKKMTVARAQLPSTASTSDIMTTSEGQPFTVVTLTPESAVIDFNHPLAGKAIVLDVRVIQVKPKA
ncbi:MAG: putative FKBP-type peptidyl-prolyl cis-trans isomerase SlyD [Nitrospira sp. OLB3]|nr:MAG: putative FKBP-type peptidyl-prolyl cis-trans isomerase SlyD [Nitrospira sp. OLB3]